MSDHFNPRSPRGERPVFKKLVTGDRVFQSTLPARGATNSLRASCVPSRISIHAPREGSDGPWP